VLNLSDIIFLRTAPHKQATIEFTRRGHSILLVRAAYIYYCSSRTSRSWWTTHSM